MSGRQNVLHTTERSREILACEDVARAIDSLIMRQIALDRASIGRDIAECNGQVKHAISDVAYRLDDAIRAYVERGGA